MSKQTFSRWTGSHPVCRVHVCRTFHVQSHDKKKTTKLALSVLVSSRLSFMFNSFLSSFSARSHASWKQVWSCFQWTKSFSTLSTVSASSVRPSCVTEDRALPLFLFGLRDEWTVVGSGAERRDWTISVPVRLLSPVLSFCNYRSKLLLLTQGCCFRRAGGQSAFTWGCFCFNVFKVITIFP